MNEDLAELKEILRKKPGNPFVLRQFGRQCLGQGAYKEAKDRYAEAIYFSPHLLPGVLLDYEKEIVRKQTEIGPYLSLVGFMVGLGEIDSAVLELEEAIEANPKNVESYNILGKIFVKQGRTDEVISLLERSLTQGVRDVALTEILAGAYLEKNRISDAVKFYEELLENRPADKQTLRVLGELYTRLEKYDDAAKKYEAMFSDDPEVSQEVIQRLEELLKKREGSLFIREILTSIYMKSLRPEQAVNKLREIMRLDATRLDDVIRRLKEVLKIYPLHPEATLALAEALRRQGNFSESVENYHDLAKNQPEYLDQVVAGYQKVLEFCPQQILARSYLAEAFLYKNQIEDALLEFENMLRTDPTSAPAVVKKCLEIVKANPRMMLAHLVLGRAYLVKGDLQRAANEAEGIIAIDKKYSPAYLLLGEAYFALKMCRKAVKILHDALSMDPYNLFVQEQYRQVKQRELDMQIESLKERLGEDQWMMSLHFDLAKLYIELGQRDDAMRELQIAIKDQSRAPFAYNFMGCIYRGMGRFDLAAVQFNRASELASNELEDFVRTVKFNLFSTYEAQGNVHKAIKGYERILQEDIDFGNLKRKVKYLKATSLKSMRTKPLLLVISQYDKGEVIALWGREAKTGSSRKEDVRLSFGQNYNNSGFDYFLKGMYKAALEEFQLAVQLDNNFAAGLNNLGVALAKEGRFSEAKLKVEDAVNMEPGSVVFHNNLGVLYLLLGQIDQAQAELEKAYTIDPELVGVCINLGDICYFKKDIRRALDLHRRAGKFDILSEIAEQRLVFKTPG